jgi:hypothetical protein
MSQETADFLFGVGVLLVFLILVFALGFLINKFKNFRFTRAWVPLQPIINGTVVEDNGGAAASWLTGVYRGRKVHAKLAPGLNKYDDGGHKYNAFELTLVDVPGQADWTIAYKPTLLGLGRQQWTIAAEEKTLQEALQRLEVIALLTSLGDSTIEYRKKAQTLRYIDDITPRWTPTPEQFQQQIELLLKLADINQQINGA